MRPLVIIETHPIQYHAPVYRELQAKFGIRIAVIYGSDFSVVGYQDSEFGTSFAWDTDLLSGYESVFLSRAPHRSRSDGRISVAGMGRALDKLQPNAVLLVGYSPAFHQVGFVRARRLGVPLLFRAETNDHTRKRGALQEFIRSSALRFWYRSCSKLLYVGQHSHEHYRRLGVPPTKLYFSPYCVDSKSFRTSERDRRALRDERRKILAIDPQDIVLLFSGKLSERKGCDLLLKAVKSLPPEIRARIMVVFVGGGVMEPALRALAMQSPNTEVRFVGFQNQKVLSPFYHAADLLVLPSRHSETWGLVVNEALHHGLPCIVSKAVGCSPDLIDLGVTGETFDTDSIESLGAALLRGLALAGRPSVRQICREKVSGYTVAKAAQGIAEAYWNVVGDSSIGDGCQAGG